MIHISDFVFVEVNEGQEGPAKVKGEKKRRIRLTLSQKARIIEESMKPGFSQSKFSKETGISTSTISEILKNKFALYCHPEIGSTSRFNISYRYNDALEQKLLEWYYQRQNEGQPVTGPLLKSKAVELSNSYAVTGSSPKKEIKFSNGWLDGFKRRNNITFK